MRWTPPWLPEAYSLAYLLAFLAAVALVAQAQRRAGGLEARWYAVIFAALVGAVVGARLMAFGAADWQALFAGRIPASTGKAYLGVLMGGLAGAGLARRAVGYPASVCDAFAVAIPAATVIGRIGCLLAGCCFGRPTGGGWGIAYAAGTPAFAAHLGAGWIGPHAHTALPVHPAPLYEIGFALALLAALPRLRRRFRAPGSLMYALLLAYCLFRAWAGGFRHDALPADPRLVGFGAVLLALVVWKEWRARVGGVRPAARPPAWAPAALTAAVAAAALGLWPWFTPTERLTLLFAGGLLGLLALGGLPGVSLGRRLALGAAALLPWAAGMQQQRTLAPADSAAAEGVAVSRSPWAQHLTLSGGYQRGAYQEICGGAHDYGMAGVGAAYTHLRSPDESLRIGLRGYWGADDPRYDECSYDDPEGTVCRNTSYPVAGLNVYAGVDTRPLGLRLGVHTGKLYSGGSYHQRHNDVEQGLHPKSFFRNAHGRLVLQPQFALRVGNPRKFFAETSILDYEPGAFPAPVVQLGFGIGLGGPRNAPSTLRVGVSDVGFYVSPHMGVSERLFVQPTVAYGSATSYQVGVRVEYRHWLSGPGR